MFVITSNPANAGKTWSNPLWVAPAGMVGILRAGEAVTFTTRADAEKALAALDPKLVRFHDLAVASDYANDVLWSPPQWAAF
jgi:hypothetical protein